MGKLLFWFFVILAAWLALRALVALRYRDDQNAAAAKDGARPREGALPSRPPPPSEAMAQCAWCGAWFPGSEDHASADGRRYCSREHRDAAHAVTAGRQEAPQQSGSHGPGH